MHFVPLLLNFLLMLIMPAILGWIIARRRRISWRFFGLGAATFVLAQLAHIPFNYLILNKLLVGATPVSRGATMVISALFLGLSAGLFEEGARYLTLRYWAKDARTWGRGLMLGAGHGGAESILLGLLGGLNVTILLGLRAGYFRGLITLEQVPQVGETLNQLAALPWYEMLFGALERSFALCIQISLSLMVMQVFARGKLRWLFIAIGWHTLIDAAVVIAASASGVYAAEAIAGLAALMSVAIVIGLREPEPKAIQPEPLARPQRTQPIQIEPTREQLEDSRYI